MKDATVAPLALLPAARAGHRTGSRAGAAANPAPTGRDMGCAPGALRSLADGVPSFRSPLHGRGRAERGSLHERGTANRGSHGRAAALAPAGGCRALPEGPAAARG